MATRVGCNVKKREGCEEVEQEPKSGVLSGGRKKDEREERERV